MASNMMDVDVPQLERIEEQKEGSSTSNEVHQSSTQSSKSKSHKQQSHYLRKRKQFLNYLKEVPAYQLLEIDHNLADRLKSSENISMASPNTSSSNLATLSSPQTSSHQSEDDKSKHSKSTKKDLSAKANRELRSLVPDPKQKWKQVTDQVEVGMVGYWDQMEDILNQLKKDGNSDLFLHRVKKSEAPDYYEVIKNPMDLGTMTKKLQKGEYKSRQTFTSDLSLIFSNCRAYNTDPDAADIVKQGNTLEKKAKELLKGLEEFDFSQMSASSPNPGSTPQPDPPSPPPSIPAEIETPGKSGAVSARRKGGKGPQKKEESNTSTSPAPHSAHSHNQQSLNSHQSHQNNQAATSDDEETTEEPQIDPFVTFMEIRAKEKELKFGDRKAMNRTPHLMYQFLEREQNQQTNPSSAASHSFCPEFSYFGDSVPAAPNFLSARRDSNRIPSIGSGNFNAKNEYNFYGSQLRKSIVSTLASHSAQFEGLSGDAVDILVEAVVEYISSISTSLSQQPHLTLQRVEEILNERRKKVNPTPITSPVPTKPKPINELQAFSNSQQNREKQYAIRQSQQATQQQNEDQPLAPPTPSTEHVVEKQETPAPHPGQLQSGKRKLSQMSSPSPVNQPTQSSTPQPPSPSLSKKTKTQ